MKENKIKRKGHFGLIIGSSIVAVCLILVGLCLSYNKLHEIWIEQCELVDPAVQVEVSPGKMVKADILMENLGLRKGANLALIDFDAKRQEVLRKIPNLRAISISRRLPNKVKIVTEERTPMARMNIRGRKSETGRVVDADGVVFIWQRGTQTLPIIRETQAPGTPVGATLSGHAMAALMLLKASLEPDRSDLNILDIDVSKPDYLLATLGNYSTAKIAWEGMDDPSPAHAASLNRQLDMLAKAIRSNIGATTRIWNATDTSTPGRIYADSKGNL